MDEARDGAASEPRSATPRAGGFGLALLAVALVALAIEGMAWIAYRIAFHERFSYAEVARLRDAAQTGGEFQLGGRPADSETPYILHPYLGYVYKPGFSQGLTYHRSTKGVNPFGFYDDRPTVLPADPSRVVVAVSGGSVAFFVSSWGAEALRRELARVPAFAGKEIVVLRYALGAYKQPQPLLLLQDVLARGGHIDVLIEIDGVNELVVGDRNLIAGISPFFPSSWASMAATTTPKLATLLGRIESRRALRRGMARVFAAPPLRFSVLASFVWRAADRRLGQRLDRLREKATSLSATETGSLPGPPSDFRDVRALDVAIARHWARTSLLLHDTVVSQGGRYFHFLQPNQWLAASKPIGAEEAKVAFADPTGIYCNLRIGLPYLRAAGEWIAAAGVAFHDLSLAFHEVPEPLYVDSCCHVNERGNDLLGALVGRIVAEEIGRGGGAAPAVRLDRLPRTDEAFARTHLARFVPTPEAWDDGTGRAIDGHACSERPSP
jgi:hypothetical protein